VEGQCPDTTSQRFHGTFNLAVIPNNTQSYVSVDRSLLLVWKQVQEVSLEKHLVVISSQENVLEDYHLSCLFQVSVEVVANMFLV
jgi:hypothetical protein